MLVGWLQHWSAQRPPPTQLVPDRSAAPLPGQSMLEQLVVDAICTHPLEVGARLLPRLGGLAVRHRPQVDGGQRQLGIGVGGVGVWRFLGRFLGRGGRD